MGMLRTWALAIAFTAAGLTGISSAVTWDNGDPGDNFWQSPLNWSTNSVPGFNVGVDFLGGPKGQAPTAQYTVDIRGQAINQGSGDVRLLNGSEGSFVIMDSLGGGSITTDVFHVQQGGRPAYEVRVPIFATTELRTRYRLGQVKFYDTITTPEVDLGRGDGVYFYGNVNATTEFKLVVDDNATNAYLQQNPESGFIPTLTTPLIHIEDSSSKFEAGGIVNANNIEITDGGRYIVKHAQGLGNAATNVTLTNGGYLQIDTPQNSLASIDVSAFSVLAGNLSGATFGPGGNVKLVEDAVLAPASGSPVPTRADLGGAILYQGVTTTNNNVVVGDNGVDAIYKGAAIGAFYGNGTMNNVTITAAPNSGNLKVVYAGAGAPTTNNNVKLFGDGTSTTTDISVLNGSLIRLTGAFNSDYDYTSNSDPTRIATFNISGEVGKEAATILDHYRTNGTHIKEGQTWNISNGKWNPGTYFAGRGQHGDVTLTNGIMQQAGTNYDALVDDGFTLTLSGRTVVETHVAANQGFLEGLGSNFKYSGTPVVTITNNQNYAIDYSPTGATPILADLWINSDISSATYQQVKFATDLHIGHEKYLYNTLYRADDNDGVGTDTGAKIVPAGNQPAGEKAVIGFAAMGGQQNPIDMEVDATGGIIWVGTTDPERLFTANSGGFVGSIPDAAVWFRRNVSADELAVKSGTARFAQDINMAKIDIGAGATLQLDSGRTATVTELLSGNGNWTGGNGVIVGPDATIAPGASVGNLTGTNLDVSAGSTLQVEFTDPDGSAGSGWDLLSITNSLDFDISGQWNLELAVFDALTRPIEETDEFLIVEATNVSNFNASAIGFVNSDGWGTANALVELRSDGIYLSGITSPSATMVPEPGTVAIWSLLGLAGFVLRRRKR